MKVFVTGTRGIPDIPGGVEKHCQELYPLIAAEGHEVVLATRRPYVKEPCGHWEGVRLEHTYAPHVKSLEAIVNTFLAVLNARMAKADILHIHGVGPALLAPVARLLGMKIVLTNHGPDYDRQKWGKTAKTMLRLGEWVGCKCADQIIVISTVIQEIVKNRSGRNSAIIYNGVRLPEKSTRTDYLTQIGVEPGNYILAVCRFVPEKGLHLLIDAFKKIGGDCRLVIAGDADHETDYSRELKNRIDRDARIVRTGYITGDALNQVFSNARLFVLPSFIEGLPIALLEAMSYGLPVLVSDIPANREVDLPPERFFRCGELTDLGKKMKALLERKLSDAEKESLRRQIAQKYNWKQIAEQTLGVYEKAIKG